MKFGDRAAVDVGLLTLTWAAACNIDKVTSSGVPADVETLRNSLEPGTSLGPVEFIVPFAVLPKTSTPPILFGQQFAVNDVFGVWALHVWTHRTNPSGLFASWNPRVHC